jgi:hypothetical protein
MGREIKLEEALRVAPDQNEFLRMIGEPVPDENAPAGKPGQRPAAPARR